jgi:diguanylate cyclase (GGDEF)-like protein
MKIRPVHAIFKSPAAKKRQRRADSGNTTSKTAYVLDDIPGIFGIPEAQVTAEVKTAMIKFALEIDRLQNENNQLKNHNHELEIMADEDPLVPVLNRRAFVRELNRTIAYTARYHTSACLAFFDINDFKQINDHFGHSSGDRVLRHVSQVLSDNVRKSDIVGRLGGDEFGVVLMQTTTTNAQAKTRQLLKLIASTPVPGLEETFSLHLSAGVCAIRGSDDVQTAMARADRLMYDHKAQKTGRSAVNSGT